MSLEGVTDATARVLAGVAGIKAAYASTAGGQGATVQAIPSDISLTPVALVTYDHFELKPGSFERIQHFVTADLWFAATSAAAAEKAMLPIISLVIAAFRSKVGLYGQGTIGVVRRGGPPRDEDVNGKPFIVMPLTIAVLEATAQAYSLGPSS